jgi:hypothetical protein
MANLETLELTINGNAESASRGLENLINSLTALSKQVGKNVGGLKLLNGQLEKLKGFSNIKFTGIEKAAKDVKSAVDIPSTKLEALEMKLDGVTEAMEKAAGKGNKLSVANKRLQQFSIEKQIKQETDAINSQTNAFKNQERTISHYKDDVIWDEDKRRAMNPQWYVDYDSPEGKRKIAEAAMARERRGNQEAIALDPSTLDKFKGVKEEAKETIPLMDRMRKGFNNFREGSKSLGKEIKSVLPKFTALHRVMRIASTMLIRTGIRTLFKGISEGLGNYYQYSKNIGGEFASVADQLSSSWATLKNQMGAAIAPALSAAIPVINSLASAATTAFNALSQLFALLTGKGSWSKATAQMNAFDAAAKKAGGGGGGMQELLAKFDELNVITSEGGGGGGGAAAAEEFSTMFEEIYDFDSKIRDIANVIRDTISWLKDNIEVVLTTVGLIGVAILGWKISKAFEDALSTIGTWIAGGALITLGVVLEYDFGKKAGAAMNGGDALNFGDIVEGAAGIIAAGIGGYMIGGGIGAAVGIGIAVTATISGIIMGAFDQKDKNKWGKISLTADEINEYVKSQFKFDVYAEIELLEAKIKNARAAKAHLNGAISEFSRNIDKIKIGVDSEQAIADAMESAKKVTEALETYLTETGSLFDTLFEINPTEVATQIKKDISDADKQLNEYLQNEGKKIADLYDQGMKNGWKGNEQEQILSLLEHLESIYQAAEANESLFRFMSSSKIQLQNMTKETAEAVLKAQKDTFDAYEKALGDATQQAYESLIERAGMAEAAGMPEVAAGLRRDAELLIDSFKDTSAKKLGDAKETMKNDWINQLNQVYGIDYTNMTKRNANNFVGALHTAFRNSEADAQMKIREFLTKVTNVGITKDAKDLFGITGWELLGQEAKLRFFTAVYTAVGVDAVKLLKDTLNISADELISISWSGLAKEEQLEFAVYMIRYLGGPETLGAIKRNLQIPASQILDVINWDALVGTERNDFVLGMIKAYGASDTIKLLKDNMSFNASNIIDILNWNALADTEKLDFVKSMIATFGVFDTVKAMRVMYSATDIIKFSGWDTLSTQAKLDLLTAMANSFGAGAALAAAKQYGINIIASVKAGLASDDKGLNNAAKALVAQIQKGLDEKDININASADLEVAVKALVEYEIKEGATTTDTTIKKTAKTPTVTTGTNASTLSKNLNKNIGMTYATGGFPTQGDLFIANEAGAELVGSINGKTSVANQGQIIEGIQRGVAEANSEQNTLLRQQNELLRGILEKDSSVRLSASAALGRTVQQSLNMYGSMVGG